MSRTKCLLINPTIIFDESYSVILDSEIISYAWDFGNNDNTCPYSIAEHTYKTPGVYLVTLTVITETNSIAIVQREIIVH